MEHSLKLLTQAKGCITVFTAEAVPMEEFPFRCHSFDNVDTLFTEMTGFGAPLFRKFKNWARNLLGN